MLQDTLSEKSEIIVTGALYELRAALRTLFRQRDTLKILFLPAGGEMSLSDNAGWPGVAGAARNRTILTGIAQYQPVPRFKAFENYEVPQD